MGRIPTYQQGPAQEGPIPGPRPTEGASPAAAGAGQAAALQRIGQGVLRGTASMASILASQQEEKARQEAWEAALQFREEGGKFVQEDLLTRQGTDAFNIYDEARNHLEKLKSTVQSRLTSDRARYLFARYAMPQAVTLLDRVGRYQTRQIQVAHVNQGKSAMETALNDAEADIDSKEALAVHLGRFKAGLDQAVQGLPKEQRESAKRANLSNFHMSVAKTMITVAEGEPEETQLRRADAALDYATEHRKEILTSEYNNFIGRIKALRNQLVADIKAKDYLAKMTYPEALEKVEKDKALSEDKKDLIRKALRARESEHQREISLQDGIKLDQFWKEVGDDQSESRIRALIDKADFSPSTRARILSSFESKWEAEQTAQGKIRLLEERSRVYNTLITRAMGEDVQGFLQENLELYRPVLTQGQLNQLRTLQATIRRGEDAWQSDLVQEFKRTLAAKFPDVQEDDPAKFNQWLQEGTQYILQKGMELKPEQRTREQIFHLVDDATSGYVIPRTFLGIGILSPNVNVPKFEIPQALRKTGYSLESLEPSAATRKMFATRYGIPEDAEFRPKLGAFYIKDHESLMKYLDLHNLPYEYKDKDGEIYPILGVFASPLGVSHLMIQKGLGVAVVPTPNGRWEGTR